MARKTAKFIGALEIMLRLGLQVSDAIEPEYAYAIAIYNGYKWNRDTQHWHSPVSKPLASNPHIVVRVSCVADGIEAETRAMEVLLKLGDYIIFRKSRPKAFKDNPDMSVVFFEVWRDNDNDLDKAGEDFD